MWEKKYIPWNLVDFRILLYICSLSLYFDFTSYLSEDFMVALQSSLVAFSLSSTPSSSLLPDGPIKYSNHFVAAPLWCNNYLWFSLKTPSCNSSAQQQDPLCPSPASYLTAASHCITYPAQKLNKYTCGFQVLSFACYGPSP